MPDIALEELRLLESIIAKHDDLRAHMMNWAVGLVTALSAAYLSDKSGLDHWGFLTVGAFVALLFFWMDAVYKVAQDRAIKRAALVEQHLRQLNEKEPQPYDGPRIGESLSPANTWKEQWYAASRIRLWFPYFALLMLVALVALRHN